MVSVKLTAGTACLIGRVWPQEGMALGRRREGRRTASITEKEIKQTEN